MSTFQASGTPEIAGYLDIWDRSLWLYSPFSGKQILRRGSVNRGKSGKDGCYWSWVIGRSAWSRSRDVVQVRPFQTRA